MTVNSLSPYVNNFISTHTLTWSVTALNGNYGGYPNISTHTLTWSVTLADWLKYENVINFNSHAHVERDMWRSRPQNRL